MQLKINSLLLIIGILSIAVGAIGAINQTIIKRLLAFSAIGHIGFMLLGIGIGSYTSYLATIVYMMIYVIMTVQTFTIILAINKNKIIELSGFSRQNLILSSSFGIGLMSIAGVPPLVGFYNKYLILMSVIEANEIIYAIIAVLLSVIAGFYYLRIIQYMYFSDQPVLTTVNKYTITSNQSIILGLTTYIILTLMSYPSLIIDLTLPNLY
jgi:NADH-quinone oxidoreductase subunit N